MKDPVFGGCRNATNKWFYNRNETRCEVFTWTCGPERNKFDTFEDCTETCTGFSMDWHRKNLNRHMFDYTPRSHGHGGRANGHGSRRNYQQWEGRQR